MSFSSTNPLALLIHKNAYTFAVVARLLCTVGLIWTRMNAFSSGLIIALRKLRQILAMNLDEFIGQFAGNSGIINCAVGQQGFDEELTVTGQGGFDR